MRDEWESDQVVVEEALEETGAITRCPVHDYLLDSLDPGAQEEAIESLEDVYGRERAEALVNRALSELPEDCPGCPGDDD